MCTGNFQEEDKRPPAGTHCVGSCVMEAGRWGSSYCFTDSDKNQWGGECLPCQGLSFEEHLNKILCLRNLNKRYGQIIK